MEGSGGSSPKLINNLDLPQFVFGATPLLADIYNEVLSVQNDVWQLASHAVEELPWRYIEFRSR